jgi:hypothetical protein
MNYIGPSARHSHERSEMPWLPPGNSSVSSRQHILLQYHPWELSFPGGQHLIGSHSVDVLHFPSTLSCGQAHLLKPMLDSILICT